MLDLNESPANQARLMGLMDRINLLYQQLLGRPDDRNGSQNPFRVAGGQTTSIGYYRDNNEDRVVIDEKHGIFVVADGMGGQAAGEQASSLAIEIVPKELARVPREVLDPSDVRQAIKQAVLTANEAILRKGESDASTRNMGTTVVLGYCRGSKLFIAHVGDSRAYLVRKGECRRITTDHNLAQALFEANTISAEELDTHRFRHVLWKYLGSKEVGEGPDITDIDLEPGDRFLLATDGVTSTVSDASIAEILSEEPSPQVASERLVKLALDNGSRDNASCVVIHIESKSNGAAPHHVEQDPTLTDPNLSGGES